jgi:hypothetical protein
MPLKLNFQPPRFDAYTIQNGGHLPNVPAAHALFHYYTMARNNQEQEQGKVRLILEGELDPVHNYEKLWRSVAFLHGVDPNDMGKFWEYVDLQCDELNLPRLTGGPRFDGKEDGKILSKILLS